MAGAFKESSRCHRACWTPAGFRVGVIPGPSSNPSCADLHNFLRWSKVGRSYRALTNVRSILGDWSPGNSCCCRDARERGLTELEHVDDAHRRLRKQWSVRFVARREGFYQ
jgi:hypothetical protein